MRSSSQMRGARRRPNAGRTPAIGRSRARLPAALSPDVATELVHRVTHRYTETGLPNVVLLNVEMRACPACGERELVTPHIEVLHGAIARALSRQTAALTPEAVRFLKRWLGLTIHCFARLMGVRHQT